MTSKLLALAGAAVMLLPLHACTGADARSVEQGPNIAASGDAAESAPEMLVYKSPTCGCCTLWVEHLEQNGFVVTSKDVQDVTEVKQTSGVPRDLFSCHTGIVDGYVIEGHVPADVIKQFLAERPAAAGLAVPGMPMGSPGMEGSRKDSYEVIAFDREGNRTVYAKR